MIRKHCYSLLPNNILPCFCHVSCTKLSEKVHESPASEFFLINLGIDFHAMLKTTMITRLLELIAKWLAAIIVAVLFGLEFAVLGMIFICL